MRSLLLILGVVIGCGPGLSAYSVDTDPGLPTGGESQTGGQPTGGPATGSPTGASTGTSTGATTGSATGTTTTGPPTGTTGTTGTTSSCAPPNAWRGPQGPVAGTFSPVYWTVGVTGAFDSYGNISDYSVAGIAEEGNIVVIFFDSGPNPICAAMWPAGGNMVPAGNWSSNYAGVTIWDTYDIMVNANDGWTDCASISGSNQDPRAWFASMTVGFGFGSMHSLFVSNYLAPAIPTWYSDYDPYVYGTMLELNDNGVAYELGYALQYAHTCFETGGQPSPLSAPTGRTYDHVFESYLYWVFIMPP